MVDQLYSRAQKLWSSVRSNNSPSSKVQFVFYWAISLLLLVAQRGQTSAEEEVYDPWKESDRPKVFVDYSNGPLRGECY